MADAAYELKSMLVQVCCAKSDDGVIMKVLPGHVL